MTQVPFALVVAAVVSAMHFYRTLRNPSKLKTKVVEEVRTSFVKQVGMKSYKKSVALLPYKYIRDALLFNIFKYALQQIGFNKMTISILLLLLL
jgi:hypothetical protein